MARTFACFWPVGCGKMGLSRTPRVDERREPHSPTDNRMPRANDRNQGGALYSIWRYRRDRGVLDTRPRPSRRYRFVCEGA